MDQHSGDGEPNSGHIEEFSSEEQCKQKYAAEEENETFLMPTDSGPALTTSQKATSLGNGNKVNPHLYDPKKPK